MQTTAGLDILQMTGTSGSPLVSNQVRNIALWRDTKPTGTAAGLRWTYCQNTLAENVFCQDNIYNFAFQNITGDNHHMNCISYWTTTSNSAGTCYGFWFDGNGNNSTSLRFCQSGQVSSLPVTHYGLYNSGGIIADLYCYEFNTSYSSVAVYLAATNHALTSYYNDDIVFVNCIHDTTALAYSINNVYGQRANVQIIGGFISSNAGNLKAIDIENSSGVVVKGVGINGAAPTTGVVYLNGVQTTGCAIVGNVFYSNASAVNANAWIALNGCSGNVIANNTMQGYATSDTFTTAIACTAATYNVIAGNSIFGYGTTGITFDANCSHNGGVNAINTGAGTGTVNTSGTTVTWETGAQFFPWWAGQTITINGTGYTVSSVNSNTSITLTTSAGTQTGVSYSVAATLTTAISDSGSDSGCTTL
jgi:hypothetical protein